MFVFRKFWRALLSWNTRFEIRPLALFPTIYITGDLAVSHCLSNGFFWVIYLFPKKCFLFVMRFFKGTKIISIGDLQRFILSTVLYIFLTLKFAAIYLCWRTFFQRISEYQLLWNFLSKQLTFSEQHWLYWNDNSHFFEAATFHKKNFFRTPSCVAQLLLCNIFFAIDEFFL